MSNKLKSSWRERDKAERTATWVGLAAALAVLVLSLMGVDGLSRLEAGLRTLCLALTLLCAGILLKKRARALGWLLLIAGILLLILAVTALLTLGR